MKDERLSVLSQNQENAAGDTHSNENAPSKEEVRIASIYKNITKNFEMVVVGGVVYLYDEQDDIYHSHLLAMDLKKAIRARFPQSWQPYLLDDTMSKIVKSLETEPKLQRSEEAFITQGYVKAENGIYDIREGKMVTDPSLLEGKIFTRKLNCEIRLNETIETPCFDQFCKLSFGEDRWEQKKNLLLEVIAFCIGEYPPIKKAVFLIGPHNCGKSVLLNFIEEIIGTQNCSHVPFTSFPRKFSPIQMIGKQVNIAGEVPSGELASGAFDLFKGITGNDAVEVEAKGKAPFSTHIRTKLLFAGNILPTFKSCDGTDSIIERMHVVRFMQTVPEERQNKELLEDLMKEMDAIVTQALKFATEFMKKGYQFTTDSDAEELLGSYKETLNPIPGFVEKNFVIDPEGYVYIANAYELYQKYCASDGFETMKRALFRNQMIAMEGISLGGKKRIDGEAPKAAFQGIRVRK